MTAFIGTISELPFKNLAYTRHDLREVRRLADPSLPSIQGNPAPGKVARDDDPLNYNVYARGVANLQAQGLKIGDAKFYQILRTHLDRHCFGTTTNQESLELVAEIGGADARALTECWLSDDRVPDFPELGLFAKDFGLGADFTPSTLTESSPYCRQAGRVHGCIRSLEFCQVVGGTEPHVAWAQIYRTYIARERRSSFRGDSRRPPESLRR